MKQQLTSRTRWARVAGAAAALTVAATAGLAGVTADQAQADSNFYLPMAGGTSATISQGPYGSFSHNNANNYHAVDLALPQGTQLFATGGGTVHVAADRGDGYGNTVYIDHGANRCTQMAHLSRIDVAVGQQVNPGDPVGAVGSTGASTGPHLHWNIVACDGYTSLDIPISVEQGQKYPAQTTITSQNPGV